MIQSTGPGAEEALYDSLAMDGFADIDLGPEPTPDETTALIWIVSAVVESLSRESSDLQKLFDEPASSRPHLEIPTCLFRLLFVPLA